MARILVATTVVIAAVLAGCSTDPPSDAGPEPSAEAHAGGIDPADTPAVDYVALGDSGASGPLIPKSTGAPTSAPMP